ncbi:MAG TPA: LppX_LprAFG lipoprotein [Chloroflexota bacterium]|nr:LppX_LprAFG lipoprotein [Chloroflexota bacterium]
MRNRADWAVSLAGLLVLLFGACGGDATDGDARAIVQDATAAMGEVTTVHFVLDLEESTIEMIPGLQVTRVEGDVVRPDRMQARMEALAFGMLLSVNFRAIGATQYVTNPVATDQWQALATPAIAGALLDPRVGVTALLADLTDSRVVGSEALDGRAVWRIEARTDNALVADFLQSDPLPGTTGVEVWIGEADSLVYRVVLTGATAAGDSDDARRTIEFANFEAPVEIIAPF